MANFFFESSRHLVVRVTINYCVDPVFKFDLVAILKSNFDPSMLSLS